MKILMRFYLTVRKPRNFLKIVFVFIGTSLTLHWFFGYDLDWGGTNLTLSIDATVASTVMLMVQEEAAAMQKQMLETLLHMGEAQNRMLSSLISIEQAHENLLLTLQESDASILQALTREGSHEPGQ